MRIRRSSAAWSTATAYFDSNVYGYIQRTGTARKVRSFLNAAHVRVWASDANLFEALRIDDEIERVARMKVIRGVAAEKLTVQRAYVEARQLLAEIRRCRPQWLSPNPDLRTAARFRREFARAWTTLREDPAYRPATAYGKYSRTVRHGVGAAMAQQKQMRGFKLRTDQVKQHNQLQLTPAFDDLQAVIDQMSFDEAWCRTSAAFTWLQALNGDPSLRDLADYLVPYLTHIATTIEWLTFWLTEIDLRTVPYSQIASRVAWAQPSRPVTAGNTGDVEHATYFLDYDHFLTGDRDFHRTLKGITDTYYADRKPPAFVDVRNPDVIEEFRTTIGAS